MDLSRFMIELLNMSFAGSVAAVIVWIIKVLLQRFPKRYSYILWILVLFRLLCPFVIPSSFYGFFPANARPVSYDIMYEAVPQIDTGLYCLNHIINPILADKFAVDRLENSVNPIQVAFYIGEVIWLIVFFVIMGFWLFKYIQSGKTALNHEKLHWKRGDYIVKFLRLLALAVHWFNPIIWVAFVSMGRDMEVSCDERTVGKTGLKGRKIYFLVLLLAGIMILTGSGDSDVGAGIEKKTDEAYNPAVPIEMENIWEETWGTNVELEYASEQRIVLRGYFGLIVCDNTGKEVKKNNLWEITHTLDLSAIEAQDMQGSGYAEMYAGKERAVISPTAYLTASVVPENPTAYVYTYPLNSEEDSLVQISEGINEQIMAVISELAETEPEEYHLPYQNVYETASNRVREEYGTGMIGDMMPLQETENERWGFLAADGDNVEDIWYGIYDAETDEIYRVDFTR